MEKHPWWKNITEEDMPNDELKLVAALCGLDTALSLLENVPGLRINVPNKPFTHLRNNYIQERYDGTNSSLSKLAIECGITPGRVLLIYKEKDLKLKE